MAAVNARTPLDREALESLCRLYWYPLYAFARHRGHPPEKAQDLTQDFFAYVLERGLLAKADPDRGRFRSFLMAVFAHFLSNQRDRERTKKRGGERIVFPIDVEGAEGRYDREPMQELTPEQIFDRSWALTLMDRVLDGLRREYEDAGRGATFEALHAHLTEDPRNVSHASIASRLGTTEGAARVAAHRLRRRYGQLLRREIAATVNDPDEVDDEIRSLFAVLQK